MAPQKTTKGTGKYRYDTNKRVGSHFRRCNVTCSNHDMRRSFASNRASAGVSIYKVAMWLGDGVEVVSKSYGHLAPKDADVNKGQSGAGKSVIIADLSAQTGSDFG